MNENMSAEEMRNELLKAKDELIAVMRQVIEPINLITCRLVEQSDMLIKRTMEEKTRVPRTRKLKYSSTVSTEELASKGTTPKPGPGKRACSICRQPGHRSTTCPQGKGAFSGDIS